MTVWKGTPGPWQMHPDATHPFGHRIGAVSSGRMHVAKVYAQHMAPDPECDANAHGMAAVPQLVEAIETALLELDALAVALRILGSAAGETVQTDIAEPLRAALRAAKVLP
jgi:hypothetical protein